MSTAEPLPPTLGTLRHAPLWLRVSVLICVSFMVCLLAGLQHGEGPRLFSVAFFSVMYLFASWAMGRAARRPDLPAAVRSGLWYITAGLVMNGLGALYLLLERYLNPSHGFFSVADGFFLSIYPLFLIGLARLPPGERRVAGWWRILVDGAVFVVGLGVPLWLFAVRPQLEQTSGLEALMIVVWPFVAFCGIFGVNAALLTRAPLPSRGALWLLIAAIGVSWFADVLFSLDAAARVIMRSKINWINVNNTISVILQLLAAWRFQVDLVPARPVAQPAAFSPVPLVAIVLVASWLVLIATTVRSNPVSIEQVLPGLILLFAVLLVRETLVMRDSRRWMAAEAQRESQTRFVAMVRNSSDVIMIVDQARRIRFASPAAMPMLGLVPETLLDQELLELAHPGDAAAGTQFVDELLRNPGATRHLHWRLRHADGTFRHFETVGSNLLRETTVEGLVLNSRDISERLALAEHMHNAAKMDAIGRLAGGVAHDFNNLLTVILANSELALMDLPADNPVRKGIGVIGQAASRGAKLTGRLMSISRSDNLQPQVMSPGERLQNITPVLQRLIEPTLTLLTKIDAASGLVKVNPDSFEQALLNLASNARDASPAGGTLTFSIRPAILTEPLASAYLTAPPGRYVVVEATDTGTGMDEATRSKLFEPFFTTKERGRGTGLGLASIYGTMKTAGGGLTVTTKPGQGTTIGIWLPEVPPEATPVNESPVAAAGGSETILLVEDEPLVRQVTHLILISKGYQVLVASEADDARRVLGSHPGPVHLLLTDVLMPGQSGPALAADLVRKRPDLRVLYMSGYTGNELGAHGLVQADTRLLVKPFTVEELTARLRKILAGPAGLA